MSHGTRARALRGCARFSRTARARLWLLRAHISLSGAHARAPLSVNRDR